LVNFASAVPVFITRIMECDSTPTMNPVLSAVVP
jgi:hypothetical protein